jgi:hypothetical protein
MIMYREISGRYWVVTLGLLRGRTRRMAYGIFRYRINSRSSRHSLDRRKEVSYGSGPVCDSSHRGWGSVVAREQLHSDG